MQHTLLQYIACSTVQPVPISVLDQWTQRLEPSGRAVVSCVCGSLQLESVHVRHCKWDTASETLSTNVCRLSLIKTKLFYLQAKSSTQLALWNIKTW